MKWVLRAAKMLAEYNVVWLEGALPPDDVQGYRELSSEGIADLAV